MDIINVNDVCLTLADRPICLQPYPKLSYITTCFLKKFIFINFACDKLKSLLKKRLNEERTRIGEGIDITVMPNISML